MTKKKKKLKGCKDEITLRLIWHQSTSDVYTDRENIFPGLAEVTSDSTLPKTTPTIQNENAKKTKQSHGFDIVHSLSQAFKIKHTSHASFGRILKVLGRKEVNF